MDKSEIDVYINGSLKISSNEDGKKNMDCFYSDGKFTAAPAGRCQDIFNKISSLEILLHLAGKFFVILKIPNAFCKSRIEIVQDLSLSCCAAHHIHSLKSTYAGSFIFDLNRKFLFLVFAARKRNTFSRSAV